MLRRRSDVKESLCQGFASQLILPQTVGKVYDWLQLPSSHLLPWANMRLARHKKKTPSFSQVLWSHDILPIFPKCQEIFVWTSGCHAQKQSSVFHCPVRGMQVQHSCHRQFRSIVLSATPCSVSSPDFDQWESSVQGM